MKDYTGKQFGRWTVIRFDDAHIGRHKRWFCRCACGTEKSVGVDAMLDGRSQSCGCLARELACNNQHAKVHGFNRTPTARTWECMKSRCKNPNDKSFSQYGGRGICICFGLNQAVTTLVELIGTRPCGRTIDRINNAGHYSCGKCEECKTRGWPMNVRWATNVEQGQNRRTNRLVTINGVTKCASEWADMIGITRTNMLKRIDKWPEHRLLAPRISSKITTQK